MDKHYVVESGVPCIRKSFDHWGREYPFGRMEVGDSFKVCRVVDEDMNRKYIRVRDCKNRYSRLHGGKFYMGEYGGWFRCWRVE